MTLDGYGSFTLETVFYESGAPSGTYTEEFTFLGTGNKRTINTTVFPDLGMTSNG
jgi:hypothetical protein